MKRIVCLLILMLCFALPGYAEGPEVTFGLDSGF